MNSAFMKYINRTKSFNKIPDIQYKCILHQNYCSKKYSTYDKRFNVSGDTFRYPKQKNVLPLHHKSPIQIWKEELSHYYDYFRHPARDKPLLRYPTPSEFDFVIIGGGIVGASIAFWLRKQVRAGATTLVIDRNLKYVESSTPLSVGGIRHQFSLPENIKLSIFGSEFLRNLERYTAASRFTLPANVSFKPFGYLTLASEKGSEQLKENQQNQLREGAHNEILTPYQLNMRYPWLNTEGIHLACHGLQDEGWFDPWAYLINIRASAMRYGAWFTEAEPLEFVYNLDEEMTLEGFGVDEYKPTNNVIIRSKDGTLKQIQFAYCIIAAGAETGKITKELLHIDRNNPGLFQLEVPIERRKRYVYYFEAPECGFGMSSPMIIDPTGLYVRREGITNHYICGLSPLPNEEPSTDNLDVDYDFFTNRVWPILAHRIPAFEQLKLKSAWAGFYDYNSFDQNAIIGKHPAYHNIYIASGFSGHGLQHAAGVGRAVMEEMLYGNYETINLDRLNFGRIAMQEPLFEKYII